MKIAKISMSGNSDCNALQGAGSWETLPAHEDERYINKHYVEIQIDFSLTAAELAATDDSMDKLGLYRAELVGRMQELGFAVTTVPPNRPSASVGPQGGVIRVHADVGRTVNKKMIGRDLNSVAVTYKARLAQKYELT